MNQITVSVLFVFLWSSVSLGWVADISSPSANPTSTLEVDVPLGSYVTVWGPWKEPTIVADLGLECTTYWVVGQRKKITPERTGYAREAVMDIPFYLLADTKVLSTVDPKHEKLFKPNQVFGRAVRIRAQALGDGTVKIDQDQVIVHVVEPPAQPDCAFGFYTDPGRYAFPKQWRKCLRLLADYGLNVAIAQPVYPYDDPNAPPKPINLTRYSEDQMAKFQGQFLAKSLDTAVEEGLFRGAGGSSTLVYSMNPEHVPYAFECGKHVDRWPKLYFGNDDEPFLPIHFRNVREIADKWHRAGYLNGTSLEAASAFQVGDCLDLWIVQVKEFNETIKEYGQRCGAEVWIYSAAMRGTNAPMHRYLTGVWAWAMRPRGVMLWAFTHEGGSRIAADGTWMARGVNEHALATPDGPLPTVGLEGYRDGIVDYRVLRDLERSIMIDPRAASAPEAAVWLQQLREKSNGGFWTNWDYHSSWEYVDTVRPPIESFDDVRHRALDLTERIRDEGGGKIGMAKRPAKPKRQRPKRTVAKPVAQKDGWSLKFSDDFERGELGKDWKRLSGDWHIKDGWLVGNQAGHRGEVMCTREFSGTQRLEYDAITDSDFPCDLSAMICTDPTGFAGGYFVGFGSNNNAYSKLVRSGEILAEWETLITVGKIHHVVAQREGNVLKHFVDGEEVMSHEDDFPLKGEGHRMFGFYIYSDGEIDNVRLYTKPE